MLQVDPVLISAVLGATILSSLVMLYIWRIHFAERALAYCTVGMGFIAIAAWSLQFRSVIPAPFATVLPPLFAVAGSFGMTLGIAAFVDRREPWSLALGTCGAVFCGLLYWSAVNDSLAARGLVMSVGVTIAVGRSAYYLLAPSCRPEGRARFAVLGVGGLMLTGAACRTAAGWPSLSGWLSLTPAQAMEVWLIVATAVEILLPVSLLLLTSERLLRNLDQQARHDSLTGILNRRAFLDRADEECARALRHARPAAVLLLDIDHFKRINDTAGHHAGDEVLRAVVAAIKATLRREDLFCRFGGEEFCLLLPDVDLAGGARVAERIRALVAALAVPFDARELCVTVSIGTAAIGPTLPSIQAALKSADLALYRAKSNGRDRVEVADERFSMPVPALP